MSNHVASRTRSAVAPRVDRGPSIAFLITAALGSVPAALLAGTHEPLPTLIACSLVLVIAAPTFAAFITTVFRRRG